MLDRMRIDASSLIAAQAAARPAAPSRTPVPADKPLFEPLNFPDLGVRQSPSVATQDVPQGAGSRPGTLLDITI
jgi:hypothetical protein